jgi:hypothetical protein
MTAGAASTKVSMSASASMKEVNIDSIAVRDSLNNPSLVLVQDSQQLQTERRQVKTAEGYRRNKKTTKHLQTTTSAQWMSPTEATGSVDFSTTMRQMKTSGALQAPTLDSENFNSISGTLSPRMRTIQ